MADLEPVADNKPVTDNEPVVDNENILDLKQYFEGTLEGLVKMETVDENGLKNNIYMDDTCKDESYMDSIPKLSILIHNEEEREPVTLHKGDDIESNPPTPKSIDPFLSFSKEWLYVTSNLDKTVYFMPPKTSGDTRKIWRYAKIPAWAFARDIEIQLIDWAYTYADLVIEDRQIKKITWTTKSNSKCSSTWTAFIRWIICSTLST